MTEFQTWSINRTVNFIRVLNPDDPTETYIAYGRHLQNLDTSASGLQVTITSAKQISISILMMIDQLLPNEEPFLWKSLYSINERRHSHRFNESLLKYSGYIPSLEPNSFKILICISMTEVLNRRGCLRVSEMRFGYHGERKDRRRHECRRLAGTCTSNLIIENCRLYIEEDYFETESTCR